MGSYLQYCLTIFTVITVNKGEYCYLRNGKEGDDYLQCEFLGRNLPIEGISLVHLKHDTKLPVIKKNLLQPFKNLTTLYITAANVERIEAGAFDGLQLEILDLFHNNITGFGNGTLNNLSTLKILDISYNQIEILNADAFNGLVSLEWLSLNANRIRSVQKGVFSAIKNLRALHMSFNNLSTIETDCFSKLIYLEYLDLSYNGLKKLESNMFSDLVALKRLELVHNGLENLPNNLFDNTSLKYLDVSQNIINSLKDNVFRNLMVLEVLDISVNHLEQLNVSALLRHSPNLQEVRMHGNYWTCNTYRKIFNAFQDNNVYVAKLQRLQLDSVEDDQLCTSKIENLPKA